MKVVLLAISKGLSGCQITCFLLNLYRLKPDLIELEMLYADELVFR